MLNYKTNQRGDTLIEVLLAITVFSLVAVGVIAIMNQSVNAAQRAIEITLVRQQIDSQVEALRGVHLAHSRAITEAQRTSSTWNSIANTAAGDGRLAVNDVCSSNTTPVNFSRNFAFNPTTAMVTNDIKRMTDPSAPVYAQVQDDTSYSIWIEKSRSAIPAGVPAAYDFRVRACWYGAGMGSTPMQLETVVRLYDVT